MHNEIILYLLAFILPLSVQGKDSLTYCSPLDFPLLLSANFGELRPNHFHNGLDIKTKGSVGHPIKCIADGYVVRVAVQHGGYGQAIYVAHPNGQTSVYGHIIRFAPDVEQRIRAYQYEHETFVCNLYFSPDEFPVKQGQIIAWSGNEGSSGGPHLHLELRNSETDEYLNPMPYYKKWLKDTKAPVASHLALYPIEGKGVVEGSSRRKKLIRTNASAQVLHAWGQVYAGISAKDLMDNTSNVYGVQKVVLYVDDKEVFRSTTDAVLPDENRMINSYVDYDERVRSRRWIMRCYKAPGNRLRLLHVNQDRGVVTINEERMYKFRFELEDNFGNKQTYRMKVLGRKQIIPEKTEVKDELLTPFRFSIIQRFGLELVVPKGYVYEDTPLDISIKDDSTGISNRYTLDAGNTPLHGYCSLAIGIKRMPVADESKYYIRQEENGWKSPVGGKIEGNWIHGKVRSFGTFTVEVDTLAPTVVPLDQPRWRSSRNIRFRVRDSESGIDNYKVYVDGKFVLFGLKKGILVIQDKEKIKKGVPHKLTVQVVDNCGNETKKHFKF